MKLTQHDNLSVGIAAEHFVCSELLLAGYRTFMTSQNCPYDLVTEFDGQLIRIQVKVTRCVKAIPNMRSHVPAYMWHIMRVGNKGKQIYNEDDFDMLALVALDIKRIAYIAVKDYKTCIHIRPPHIEGGKQFDDFPFEKALLDHLAK